jgi:hypothetical protein
VSDQPGGRKLSDGLVVSEDERFWWDRKAKKWVEIADGSGVHRQIQRELHGAPSSVSEEPKGPGFFKSFGHAIQAQVERERAAQEPASRPASASSSVGSTQHTQVKVKSYKNEKDFEHDAEKMLRDGWELEGQSTKNQKTAIARTTGKVLLTGGIGLLIMGRSKKGDTITVTWVR